MLDQAQRNPITTLILVGAIATFAAEASGRSILHLQLIPALWSERPWTLVTSILPHGGILHLVFNLYWTWPFGCAVESRLGSAKYALFVLLAAAVSMGSEMIVGNRVIGLSGVVYALVAFAWARGRYDNQFRGLVDDSLRNFFVLWFFICIALTELDVMRIGNVAHGMGAVIGWALGQRRTWIRFAVPVVFAFAFAARPMVAPYDPLRHLFDEALEELEAGRYDEAVETLEALLAKYPVTPEALWNLSVAHQRQGNFARAGEYRARALALDPTLEERLKR
jgi:membrane associated rhomboid family serine protease